MNAYEHAVLLQIKHAVTPRSESTSTKVIGGIALLALGVPALVYRAFVGSLLWAWFVVPILDVRPLNLGQAIGLQLLVSLALSRSTSKHDATHKLMVDHVGDVIATGFVGPSIVLFVAWLVTKVYR